MGRPFILTTFDFSKDPRFPKTANRMGCFLKICFPFKKLKPKTKTKIATTASIPTLVSLLIFMKVCLRWLYIPIGIQNNNKFSMPIKKRLTEPLKLFKRAPMLFVFYGHTFLLGLLYIF